MKCFSRCLYDVSVPNLSFDENERCNYCHIHDQLNQEYPVPEEGKKHLEAFAEKIREEGCGKADV